MSSDIDIEEHDVFEHPTIKKNFPDLSRIKTEVNEIDSEEASECHSYCDPRLPTTSEHELRYFDNDDILDTDDLLAPVYSKNKIILGSKKLPSKINLGSKPKTQEKDPLSVQVILKDWSYIFKNHPFYCKQCLILFPTQNTLDAHGMSVHSLLVVKDEIDVELNAVNELQDDSNEALVRCPVCSYYFTTLSNFHIHRVIQHNTEDIEPIYDTSKGDFCSYKYSYVQSYSKHISNHQIDVYKNKLIDDGSLSVNVETSNSSDNFKRVNVNKAKKSTSKCVVVTNKNQIAKKSTAKNVTLIKNKNNLNVAKKSTAKLGTTFKKDSIIGGNIARESTTEGVAVVIKTNNKAVKSTAKVYTTFKKDSIIGGNIARESTTGGITAVSQTNNKDVKSPIKLDTTFNNDDIIGGSIARESTTGGVTAVSQTNNKDVKSPIKLDTTFKKDTIIGFNIARESTTGGVIAVSQTNNKDVKSPIKLDTTFKKDSIIGVNIARESTTGGVIAVSQTNNKDVKSPIKLDTTLKKDSIIGGNIARESTTVGVTAVSQTNNKAVKSTAKSSLDSSVEVDQCDLKFFKCPICGIYFKYLTRYIKHCQANHQALYLTPRHEAFNSLCFCGYKAQNYIMLSKHLSRTHVDIYRKIATDIQEFYCFECNLTFTTENSLHIHKIAKHNENSEPLETVHSQAEEGESFRPEINSLKRKSALEASTDSKITKFNGNSSQEDALYNNETEDDNDDDEIDSTNNSTYNSDDDCSATYKVVILPNKIIFKCPSCSLHFVSSRSAYYHFIQCKGSTADFICSICNLGLKYRDTENHKLQHHLFNKISVIEINQEIFSRLVFVCVDCKVGFDGRVIWQHFKCNNAKSTICQECNLKINNSSLPQHIKLHERGLVPFVVEVIRGDLNDLKISKPNTEDSKNVLYYCHICNSYDIKKQLKRHELCFDKNNDIFEICRHCGLRFTQATYEAHIEQHRNRNSKLSEFKFIDIHTGKTIKPKIPDWNKCNGRCKIKYSGEKQRHECFEEKAVYCSICKETFNELAYKIHMQYHEYEIPNNIDDEIMEKYLNMLSLWNIVYRCQYCDIIFDNYDLVIEHSQDHFSEGSYEISKEKCSKCHLTFAKAVFDRHTVLHNGADIDKDSFQILNFYHKNLLNDSWYEIFKPISDEQKNHILGKSIYDLQRGIRLELNVDGPSNNTLYKCALCEAVVDAPSIIEHANNRDACAVEKQKLDCSVCKLSFLTMQSLSDHKTLHSNAEYKFRILIFNRPDHFEINEPLIKDLRKESLKFNWCQVCSVLIKKDKFKAHMLCHRKVSEVTRNIPRSNLLYKCVICKGGIISKRSLPTHRCLPKRCFSECKYCKLLFLPKFLKRHYDLHKTLSKYHIVPFKNGVILNRGPTQTVTLYQCIKCEVCVQGKYSVLFHTCVPLSQQATCTLCNYKFKASILNKHMVMHARNPNITTASVVIVKYTLDSDITIRHSSIVYKCDCNLLFIKQEKLLKHLGNNSVQQILCSKDTEARICSCGLKFHEDSIEDHLKLRVDCSTVQSYILVNIKIGKGATSDTKRWLWVCATCNVHSMYLKDVSCHTQHESHKKKLCQICKVYFPKDILGLHIKWHHKILTCNIADLHKQYVRNVSAKELQLECLNRNIGDTVITDVEDDGKLNTDDDEDKPVLYKCLKCNLYFTTDRQFDYHFHAAKHNSAQVKCQFCKFSFTTHTIKFHLSLHHSEPNYQAEDFIIKTVTEEKIKNAVSYQPKKKLDKKYRNILNISTDKKKKLRKKIASTPLEMLKTIHQCGKCQLNTVLSTSMDSHIARGKNSLMCGSKENLRHCCPECGLNFTVKSLAGHYFLHHTKLNLKLEDFNIKIYSSEDNYITTSPNRTLNEDETSESLTEPQLVNVKKIQPLVTKPVVADRCNKISSKSAPSKPNYQAEDFIIKTVTEEKIKNVVSCQPKKELDEKYRNILNISSDEKKKLRKKIASTPLEMLKTIHQCGKCQLNTVISYSMDSHIARGKNSLMCGSKENLRHCCPECGLNFTVKSLARHYFVHHTKLNLKLEDFNIKIYSSEDNYTTTSPNRTLNEAETSESLTEPQLVNVKKIQPLVTKPVVADRCNKISSKSAPSEPNCQAEDFIIKTVTEEKIKNVVSCQPKKELDEKYRNILKLSSDEKKNLRKKIASTPLEMLKTIHQCGKCQLNTVISTSMDSHIARGKNSLMCGSKENLRHCCPECGLNFTVKSLARHYFVHHTKLNLKLEDFNIKIYSSEDNYTTTSPNRTLNEAETSESLTEPQLVDVKKIQPLVTKPVDADNVIPQPVLVRPAHAKANNPSGYDEPAPSTINEPKYTAVSKKSIELNENAPKLFKCRDCDVYFATYEMCYDHTIRHKPLDPTEFIACKVCDLQIICECLGVHMKGHREGTFLIDDLVVTEFRPRDGLPSVQTYLAAELFDSNLISTTTICGD